MGEKHTKRQKFESDRVIRVFERQREKVRTIKKDTLSLIITGETQLKPHIKLYDIIYVCKKTRMLFVSNGSDTSKYW